MCAMLYPITGALMNPMILCHEQREDETRIEELMNLFDLCEDVKAVSARPLRLRIQVLRGVDAVSRLINAIIYKLDYRAQSESIWQLLKVDEIERTKLIINRLKREAKVFQLIKYSNHMISIYPKLQTMNYIEA